MKYLLSILLFPLTIFAQEIHIESKMDNETAFERDLKAFENIVYYNFDFVSDQEKNLHFQIIEKEFDKGILTQDKIYFDSKNVPEQLLSNTVSVGLLSKYTSSENYKSMMRFYNIFSMNRNYELEEQNQHSFKIFINVAQKFQLNKTYLFAGIIKPIKIDVNTYRDCDFSIALDKYEQWYDVFGLDHYYIYEIKFY